MDVPYCSAGLEKGGPTWEKQFVWEVSSKPVAKWVTIVVRMLMRQPPFSELGHQKAGEAVMLLLINWSGGEIDSRMFTFFGTVPASSHMATHYKIISVPFIIIHYSPRPHLVCYYQRSLLFPSMYVQHPSETNMSTADNHAILVNSIVYMKVKT